MPKDPLAALKQQYDSLVGFMLRVQNVLDDFAGAMERWQVRERARGYAGRRRGQHVKRAWCGVSSEARSKVCWRAHELGWLLGKAEGRDGAGG